MSTEVTYRDDNQIDVTIWCCYGNYPDCPDRPCSPDMYERCTTDCQSGDGCIGIIEEYDWISGMERGLFECDVCGHVCIDWKPLESKVCPQCFTVRYFWSPFPEGTIAVEDES